MVTDTKPLDSWNTQRSSNDLKAFINNRSGVVAELETTHDSPDELSFDPDLENFISQYQANSY